MWTPEEKERKAIQLALDAFKNRIIGKDLLLMSDNATVAMYLKQKETISLHMCKLAQDIIGS